jgi:hypothetical protein
MRYPPLVEDSLALLAEAGIAGEVEQGRHFKVRFENQLGRKCMLSVSLSPGSRRARKQNLSQLRRLMRCPPTGR